MSGSDWEVAWLWIFSCKWSLSTCTSYTHNYHVGPQVLRVNFTSCHNTEQHWKPGKGNSPVPSRTHVHLSIWETLSIKHNYILIILPLTYIFSNTVPQINQWNQSKIILQCGFQQKQPEINHSQDRSIVKLSNHWHIKPAPSNINSTRNATYSDPGYVRMYIHTYTVTVQFGPSERVPTQTRDRHSPTPRGHPQWVRNDTRLQRTHKCRNKQTGHGDTHERANTTNHIHKTTLRARYGSVLPRHLVGKYLCVLRYIEQVLKGRLFQRGTSSPVAIHPSNNDHGGIVIASSQMQTVQETNYSKALNKVVTGFNLLDVWGTRTPQSSMYSLHPAWSGTFGLHICNFKP